MNNYSTYLSKDKRHLEALQLESEQLLEAIEAEQDENKCIELIRDFNNLQGRVDRADKLVNKDSKQKTPVTTYRKITTRQSKRCG